MAIRGYTQHNTSLMELNSQEKKKITDYCSFIFSSAEKKATHFKLIHIEKQYRQARSCTISTTIHLSMRKPI